MLTAVQAAVAMGISERGVRRLAEKGEIDRVQQGRRYLYRVVTTSADTAVNPIVLRDSLLNVRGQVRELELIVQGQKASRFRWRLVAASAIVSAAILGGAVSLLFGTWKGQASELEQTRQHLTATTQTMQQQLSAEQTRTRNAESRADMAQQRLDEISREVIEQLRRDQDDQDTQADDWL